MHDEIQLIELLNQDCYCISLDPVALKRELEIGLATHGLYQDMLDSRPNLFAALPVFVNGYDQTRNRVNQSAACVATCCSLPGSSNKWVAPGMIISSFSQLIWA